MKKIIEKYFLHILALAYLISRLYNLKIIPIFTDEAIYSYWAQVAKNDPQNRFISLEDGKQPLFIWLSALFQSFLEDPMLSGRLVSVLAGLFAIFGVYFLAKELFNKKVARIASLLYLVLPFTLLYDRMGIYDSLLTAFGIYTLLFAAKIAKNPKLSLALLNGITLGLAYITKSSAQFFIVLLPTTLLLFDNSNKNLLQRFIKWSALSFASVFISVLIYNSLRISPLFFRIGQKNLEFIRSTQEVISDPFAHFLGNLTSIVSWMISYNGYLLLTFAVLAALWGILKFKKPILLLLAYIVTPIAAEVLFNKVLYPRFSLFYFPYLIILMAYFVQKLLNTQKIYFKLSLILITLSLVTPLSSSFFLLTDPPKAQIAQADKNQFVNDWPAGYGVEEVVEFLKKESQNQKVYVATEGTFGLLPFALQIYFYGQNNIQIVGFWPVDDNNLPDQVLQAAKERKSYFVFNEKQKQITNPSLKLISTYQKGQSQSYMRLYEVIP